jgi:hypothetical protein
MDKYLHNTSLLNWLRRPTHNFHSVSRMWASLLRSLPVIIQWISWNPGDGHLIAIGKDKILGIDDLSLLNSELISFLNTKQVHTLSQAAIYQVPGMRTESYGGAMMNWE